MQPTTADATTAQLVMHFILPEYRGRKLAALFYAAGLDWARRRNFRRCKERMRLGKRKDVTTKNVKITKTMEGGFSNPPRIT